MLNVRRSKVRHTAEGERGTEAAELLSVDLRLNPSVDVCVRLRAALIRDETIRHV